MTEAALEAVLTAFVVRNRDPGYAQGMNFMVGFLLALCGSEESAFWTFCGVVEHILPKEFFNMNPQHSPSASPSASLTLAPIDSSPKPNVNPNPDPKDFFSPPPAPMNGFMVISQLVGDILAELYTDRMCHEHGITQETLTLHLPPSTLTLPSFVGELPRGGQDVSPQVVLPTLGYRGAWTQT